MRRISLKFAVGLLTLVAGIAVVWASGLFQGLLPAPANVPAPVSQTTARQQPTGGTSDKVLIYSKGFEYGKGWVAHFEIINETAQPIFYVGSKGKDRFDYCTLAVKREEPFPANHDGKIDKLTFKIRDVCYYGTFLTLQSLAPGESLLLSVEEHEVRDLRHIKDPKQDTIAQIGFEFFVGEERRREILWSEEIKFPYDEHR